MCVHELFSRVYINVFFWWKGTFDWWTLVLLYLCMSCLCLCYPRLAYPPFFWSSSHSSARGQKRFLAKHLLRVVANFFRGSRYPPLQQQLAAAVFLTRLHGRYGYEFTWQTTTNESSDHNKNNNLLLNNVLAKKIDTAFIRVTLTHLGTCLFLLVE